MSWNTALNADSVIGAWLLPYQTISQSNNQRNTVCWNTVMNADSVIGVLPLCTYIFLCQFLFYIYFLSCLCCRKDHDDGNGDYTNLVCFLLYVFSVQVRLLDWQCLHKFAFYSTIFVYLCILCRFCCCCCYFYSLLLEGGVEGSAYPLPITFWCRS